jgi:hypothetical protein
MILLIKARDLGFEFFAWNLMLKCPVKKGVGSSSTITGNVSLGKNTHCLVDMNVLTYVKSKLTKYREIPNK